MKSQLLWIAPTTDPCKQYICVAKKEFKVRGGSRIFFRRGALVSCSTSTPINHIVFFLQNTSCIRKPQVIWGGGEGVRTPCTLPLDPPLKVLALSLSSQTNVSYSFRTGSVLLSLLYFLVICFTIFQKSLDPLTFLRNLSFQYSASTFLMTLFTSFPKDMHISFPVFLTTRFLKLA